MQPVNNDDSEPSMTCLWCFRRFFEKDTYTESKYIGESQVARSGEIGGYLFPLHRVQIWGAGSEVAKACSKDEPFEPAYWHKPACWPDGSPHQLQILRWIEQGLISSPVEGDRQ